MSAVKNLLGRDKTELALHVINDEYFFNESKDLAYLKALCNEEFIFNDSQWDCLVAYLENQDD